MNRPIRDTINQRYERQIRVQSESQITPEFMKPDILKDHELIHKLIMVVCEEDMTAEAAVRMLGRAASEIEAAAMLQKL